MIEGSTTSRSLPVLTFHAVDDRPSVISFAPGLFAEGMGGLHARGYRTIRLSEAVASLRERRRFPDRTVVVTFDDGFQSVYREAFPVLQRYGMTATVFLIAGADDVREPRVPTFEGRPTLTWPEIREMHAAGIEFGAHTLTHPDLTRLSGGDVAAEMSVSKARLEDALGAPVTTFAYPFGRYDAQSHRIAQEYFTCACADTLGVTSTASDPYALERVDAYYLRSPRLLTLMTSPLLPWYVGARNLPRRLRRSLQRMRPS